jgi:hypothetical protein
LIDYITANCTIERNNTPSSSSLQYIHHGAFPPPYYYSVISVSAAATTTEHQRRLNVLPSQSIATEIQTAHAAGNLKPRFTLHAADKSFPPPATAAKNNNNIFSASTSTTTGTDVLFEVRVREMAGSRFQLIVTAGSQKRAIHECKESEGRDESRFALK